MIGRVALKTLLVRKKGLIKFQTILYVFIFCPGFMGVIKARILSRSLIYFSIRPCVFGFYCSNSSDIWLKSDFRHTSHDEMIIFIC